MKHLRLAALTLGLALLLTACGDKEEDASSAPAPATAESAAVTPAPTEAPTPTPTVAPTATPVSPAALLTMDGQWGGMAPDGTAWLVNLKGGKLTLESQAPDADAAETVAELSLADLKLDTGDGFSLGDYSVALVPQEGGFALRINDLYLTPQDAADPARLWEDLAGAQDLLAQLEQNNFWMACVGSDLYSLHMTPDGLTLTCYTQQDGQVTARTVTGTFTVDADGLRVVDGEGQTVLDFDWTMAAEEDALQRLDLAPTLTAADLQPGENLSFYATQAADEAEADAMARSYLENRQTPDPAKDDLTTLLQGYRGVSIVDACILNGLDPSLENRATYAEAFGIENYRGTAEQNLFLLTSMGGVIE